MNLKSILKPDASVMAALATAGSVFAVYNLTTGSVAQAHASDANMPALESSRKKAAYTSFILVSSLFLITRDGNIATLGYGSIIASEVMYRHGIMVEPQTNKMAPPSDADFANAGSQQIIASVPAPSDVAAA